MTDRLLSILSKETQRVTVLFSPEVTGLGKIDTALDIHAQSGEGLIVSDQLDLNSMDVLVMTMHGSAQVAPLLSDLRAAGWDGAILLWLWDNHLAIDNNRTACDLADVVFPSHAYCADRLAGIQAILGPHVPACANDWSPALAQDLYNALADTGDDRNQRLWAGYVDDPFAPRGAMLRRLRDTMPETVRVRLMDPDDRSAYFGQSRPDRFQEWVSMATSLALPVDRDLSDRVFVGLLAGHVVVCGPDIPDMDLVFPGGTAALEDYGIVTFDRLGVSAIRDAHTRAVELWHQGGPAAARARHEMILNGHMVPHRIAAILDWLRDARIRVRQGDRLVDTGARPEPGTEI